MKNEFMLDANVLKAALEIAATHNIRYVMNGVHIYISVGVGLVVESTDGNVIFRDIVDSYVTNEIFNVVVPGDKLKEALKGLKKNSFIHLAIDGNQTSINGVNFECLSKFNCSSYPNIENAINNNAGGPDAEIKQGFYDLNLMSKIAKSAKYISKGFAKFSFKNSNGVVKISVNGRPGALYVLTAMRPW